jgi:nucleotide-binding universal stress UspA family protein
MTRIRHVLFASDLSPESRRALDRAIAIASGLGARLTIVNILAPPIPIVPDWYVDAVTLGRLEKQAREWCTRQLAKLSERARKAGVRTQTLLKDGDAADQIVRTARSTRADLIVVGTHGRRGLPKFVLGSVADRVIRTASCPVVTVRGS